MPLTGSPQASSSATERPHVCRSCRCASLLMHYGSGVKVDMIVRKSSEYRALEFARRSRVPLGEIQTWIVSREDLILSKLVLARESASELQLRDVRQLLAGPVDTGYLHQWAAVLGVESLLEDVQR